ncbi:MAG: hypothetical protein K2M41_01620 [Muribaculaceae bacterium]|nr:hypothetical protein [Muribaculaceae bacterium]
MTKSIVQSISLRLPSALPDITCIDGEVDNFSNIPWLSELLEEESDSSGAAGSIPYRFSATLEESGVTLPPGASLIGIHSVCSDTADGTSDKNRRFFYFFISDRGALGYTEVYGNTSVTRYFSGYSKSLYGEITGFHIAHNLIFLLTDEKMLYLLYHPSSNSWDFADSLPSAPQLTLSSSPAQLAGWTLVAGNRPSALISIPLADPDSVSQSLISDFLSGKSRSALSTANARKISDAIFDTLNKLNDDAERNGKFLFTPSVISAYAEIDAAGQPFFCLPSASHTITDAVSEISASIDDFEWWNGTLSLRLIFSLIPMEVAASITSDESATLWRDVFNSLNLFIKRKRAVLPSSAPLIYPDNLKFNFSSLSVGDDTPFNLYRSAQVSSLSQWILNIDPRAIKSVKYVPDYRDHSIYTPKGIVSIRNIRSIYGGTAKICDESGDFKETDLRNCIISAYDPAGVLFHNYTTVSSEIIEIFPAAGVIFSTTGIEKYTLSSNNGSVNNLTGGGKVLSSIPPLSDPFAATDDGVAYFNQRGLQFLSVSSKISTLLNWDEIFRLLNNCGDYSEDNLVLSASSVMRLSRQLRLVYDYPSDTLLILYPVLYRAGIISSAAETAPADISSPLSRRYGLLIYDRNSAKVHHDPLTLPGTPLSHYQHLHHLSATGLLYTLRISKRLETSSKTDTYSTSTGDEWSFTTRPLKFNLPFSTKRILSIMADAPEASILLEASDNLRNWYPILSTPLPAKSLHLPAYRYYRLSAKGSATAYPHLLHFKILP